MGSGKTNLMGAALASLSNDFSGFPQTRSKLVRRGKGIKESYVESHWSLADGSTVSVRRGLKGMKSALIVNGEDSGLTRERDITQEVAKLFAMEPKKAWSSMRVAQGEVDAILKDGATDRIKALCLLFNCETLLPSTAPLTEELAWTRGRLSIDLEHQLKEAINTRAMQVTEAWTARLALRKVRSKYVDEDSVEEARQIVKSLDEKRSLLAERQRLTSLLAKRKGALSSTQETLDASRLKMGTCLELLTQAERHETEAQSWDAVDRLRRRVLEAQRSAQETLDELSARVYTEPTQVFEGPEDEVVDAWKSELSDVRRTLRLAESGKSECATCGQSVAKLVEDVPGLREREALLASSVAESAEQAKNYQEYLNALRRYESDTAQLVEDVAEAEVLVESAAAEVESLPPDPGERPKAPEFSVQQLKEYEGKIEAATAKATKDLAEYNQSVGACESELAAVRVGLEKAERWDSAGYEAAKKVLADHEERQEQLRATQRDYDRKLNDVQITRKTLKELKAKLADKAKLMEWSTHLEKVKEAIRPINLPKQVLEGMMDSITKPMTSICQHMRLPFRISHDEDLKLVAKYDNGFEEPANCLSGGQMGCVAVAFWLSKLIQVRTGPRILFLDEPAAHMDTQAVAQFSILLRELDKVVTASGCQVFLTTHHQPLEGCGKYGISLY